jgi:chromosome segregation ATPase
MKTYNISRAIHSTEYYNKVEAKTLEEAIEKVRNNLLPDYEQIDDAETPVENVSSTADDVVNNALRKVQELNEAMDKVWHAIGDCGEVPSNTEENLEFLEDQLQDLGKSVGGFSELVFQLDEFGKEGSNLNARLANQD